MSDDEWGSLNEIDALKEKNDGMIVKLNIKQTRINELEKEADILMGRVSYAERELCEARKVSSKLTSERSQWLRRQKRMMNKSF